LNAPYAPVLPIPATLRYESVDNHLQKLERLMRAHPNAPVELDWKHVATVDPGAGAVVATALLGSFADRRIVITLPDDEGKLEKLARVGLTFAIANREPSLTELQGADPERLGLQFWSRSWSRTADLAPVQGTLFTSDEVGEEDIDLERGERHRGRLRDCLRGARRARAGRSARHLAPVRRPRLTPGIWAAGPRSAPAARARSR